MFNNQFNSASNTSATVNPTANPSYAARLDSLVRNNDYIIIAGDAASKGRSFDLLMSTLIPLLRKYGKTVTVMQASVNALRTLSTASLDSTIKDKAQRALEGINALYGAGIITLKGDPNSEDANGQILKFVFKNVFKSNILLITQNAPLAVDCNLLSRIKSTHLDNSVTVRRISTVYGEIDSFDFTSRPAYIDGTLVTKRSAVAESSNASQLLSRFGL